ncbi:MAG: 7-carboxy-7-deazaguanine synthase QueE [Pseudomonadota bacterium]
MQLPIIEKFLSIQGEGKNCGRVSYFLRLAGCNLNCTWCDTKYSWNEDSKALIRSEDILSLSREINSNKAQTIVITGGEPCLYKLDELISRIKNKTIEIETNGSIIPSFAISGIEWSVSPKLKNAGQNVDETVIQFWKNQSKLHTVYFKFVARNDRHLSEDLNEIKDLAEKFQIDSKLIYVMQESRSKESQLNDMSGFIEKLLEYNFNYSPRIHTIAWDGMMGK